MTCHKKANRQVTFLQTVISNFATASFGINLHLGCLKDSTSSSQQRVFQFRMFATTPDPAQCHDSRTRCRSATATHAKAMSTAGSFHPQHAGMARRMAVLRYLPEIKDFQVTRRRGVPALKTSVRMEVPVPRKFSWNKAMVSP